MRNLLAAVGLVLTLSACETVTETLIINETGSGSLIVEWAIDPDDADHAAQVTAAGYGDATVDRATFNEVVDDLLGTSDYELNDQVAFGKHRGNRKGLSITKPLNELEELEQIGRADLTSGRQPSMLWHNIELSETGETYTVTAEPDIAARQQLLTNAASNGANVDDMVFVAAFEVRGQILEHNADEVNGNKVLWRIDGSEPATLTVSWQPIAPESQSALPFAIGLIAIVAALTAGLYLWEKRNLDRFASSSQTPERGRSDSSANR